MKKTVLVLVVAVMVIGTMSVAFADASWGPLAIFEKKGYSVDEVYEMRSEGMTLGELAKEEGFYEEFQEAALEQKKVMIAEMVTADELTEEEAATILAAFENCDGTQRQILQETGLFGQGAGNGQGNGLRAMDGEGFGANGGFGGGQMGRGGRN